MNNCTEKSQRWPDTLADVSPDKLEEFLDHAEVCSYHAKKLRAEEESFRSVFRLARGLDSHGRVLEGAELKAAITEHRRCQSLAQKAKDELEFPFDYISLTNCGEFLGGVGKCLDFRSTHTSKRELDMQGIESGVQIWGVNGEGESERKTLLGFYPLAGVRHTGEELLLPIANGYTVGLKVDQIGESLFNIELRSVQDEVLERERVEASDRKEKCKKAAARATHAGASYAPTFSNDAPLYQSGTVPPAILNSEYRVAYAAFACLFIAVLVMTFTPRHALAADQNPSPKECIILTDNSASASVPKPALVEVINQVKSGKRRSKSGMTQLSIRSGQKKGKQPSISSTMLQGSPAPESKTAVTENSQTTLSPVTVASSQSKGLEPNPAVWYLESNLNDSADGRLVVHAVSDAELRDRLLAEIDRQKINVIALDSKIYISSQPQFQVTWSIERQEKSVTVNATISGMNRERVLSFRGDGSCQDQACKNAISAAVAEVFTTMQGLIAMEEREKDPNTE